MKEPIRKQLIDHAKATFILNPHREHGYSHWQRVEQMGLRLAKLNHVNPAIPTVFAYLHDHMRESDGHDPEHGLRGALAWVRYHAKHQQDFQFSAHESNLIYHAICEHSEGHTSAPLEVMLCWDADRLDLPRIGVSVDPARLCTASARRLLATNDVLWPTSPTRKLPSGPCIAPQYGHNGKRTARQ